MAKQKQADTEEDFGPLGKLTTTRIKVISAMLEDARKPVYGQQLSVRTSIEPATVSGILRHLEEIGWVDHKDEQGTRRRLYKFRPKAAAHARKTLAKYSGAA